MTVTCKTKCVSGSGNSQKLVFLEPPTETDERNEVSELPDPQNWTVVAQAYGSFETGSGREVYRAQQTNAEITAVARCDWSAKLNDIQSYHLIRVNKRYYHIIVPINEHEANTTMIFWCRTVK